LFQFADQRVASLFHLVLPVEQLTPQLVALLFKLALLLLPVELLLQGGCNGRRSAYRFDLCVDLLDVPPRPIFRSSTQASSFWTS